MRGPDCGKLDQSEVLKTQQKGLKILSILISNHLNLKVSTIDNLQLSTKPTKSSDLRSTMLKLIKLNFFVNFLPGRCPMSKDNHHEKCNERIC